MPRRRTTAVTAGMVFARRLREVRTRKGWTQQELADELTRLGMTERPISRVTLAKIEAGGEEHTNEKNRTRAQNISVEEALAISVALGVAPVHMVATPSAEQQDALIEVTPRMRVRPDEARRWIRGEEPLRAAERQFFDSQVAAEEWGQRENRAYRAVNDLRGVLGHLLSGEASEPREILLQDVEGFAKDVVREVKRYVRSERSKIGDAG